MLIFNQLLYYWFLKGGSLGVSF